MASDFMDRFKFNTVSYIQNLKKKPTKTFRECATRWRSEAAKVRPTLKEEQMKKFFVRAQDPQYNERGEKERKGEDGRNRCTTSFGYWVLAILCVNGDHFLDLIGYDFWAMLKPVGYDVEGPSRASNLFCKCCKKPGHLIDKCFKLHGFPANFKFTKGIKAAANMVTDSDFSASESSNQISIAPVAENAFVVSGLAMQQYSQLLFSLHQSHVSDPAPQLNIMSSANFAGASNHLTSNKEYLINITPLPIPFLVTLPNGYKGLSLKKPLNLGKLDSGLYKFVWEKTSHPQSKQHFVSRDVIFHEQLFPFSSNFSLPVVSKSPLSTTSSSLPIYWSEPVLPPATTTHSPLSASFPSDAPSFLSDAPSFPNATDNHLSPSDNHPSPSDASLSPHLTDAFFDSVPLLLFPPLLVIRGDTQIEGVDFNEIFSPVVKMFTVKCLIVVAIKKNWSLFQLGVNNAFLRGELDEEVCMKLPLGLSISSPSSSAHLACKLKNSLYGLRQASRQWSLPDGVVLNQKKFTSNLLKDYDYLDVHSIVSPLELNQKLKADVGDLLPNPEKYRSLMGKLLYLKGTLDLGLFYSNSTDFSIKAYSDSDWAACPDARKSVSSFYIFLGDSLVGWKSKKQPVISLSSTVAEYRAISKVVAELVWLSRLLHDLTIDVSFFIFVFCDNMAAIHIAKNHVFHERTKHIEVDYHFIWSKLTEGFIQLSHVPTPDQLADVFTKPLPGVLHHSFLGKLKVVSPPT
ncbi:PREDICTED: uncharacterized protein LOC109221521 [Nicotiana attenuata]|uniref:uncharacterized protein LOC109221521 n=1 Tax=Nicotiana attenuata TaxID=49451 RepID=UPI0009049CCF|nr:PREDICTED: uncharacterized protein LOC109221521 [Nicotiana attenuata]